MAKNNIRTSAEVASKASKILNKSNSNKAIKSVAASTLSNRRKKLKKFIIRIKFN